MLYFVHHRPVDEGVQWVVKAGWSGVHLYQVGSPVGIEQDVVAQQLVHVVC